MTATSTRPAPDITDAFAQAALAQDAHIYIVEQNQMPTDKSVARPLPLRGVTPTAA